MVKKLRNSMCQAPNLERLLCKSKFMPVEEHFRVNSCGKNCVCCPYLLKASCYLFKRVNKVFFLKNNFNCESRNLTYVVICQGCQEEYIGETACLVKKRMFGKEEDKRLQATHKATTISTNKSGGTSSLLFS